MLYKVTPFGYFGRVSQISRGPWFAELNVEDDGLEWYYVYLDGARNTKYLLSNNMSYEDRESFARMYWAQRRASLMATAAGAFVGFEVMTRHPYFRTMASGWKICSFFAVGYAAKTVFNMWSGRTYAPIIGAYLRKYDSHSTNDTFEITDRRREFYQIDDSQYMNYTEEDLTDHRHVSHGPQPDGIARDSTWLEQLDLFLDGKENTLKEHPRYLKYDYKFIDKSFPSAEQAKDLITKQ